MSGQTIINLQEKRDFGQVINATFGFIRLNYKTMYKDLLLIAGPFFVLAGIFGALFQYESLSHPGFGTSYIKYLLSITCSLLGWTIATAIVGNYIYEYKINGGTGFGQQGILANAKKDFLKIISTNIVYFLLCSLGMVLLIIPGIYLFLALSLCTIIRVLNKESSLGQSFDESRRLLKGRWWKTFGLYFILSIIITVFSMVFSIPGIITTFLITFNSTVQGGNPEQFQILHIIFMAIGQLGYVLVSPILLVAMAIYYYSLKENLDEVSLLEKIELIGTQETSIKENEGSY